MNFEISAEIFVRLANVSRSVPQRVIDAIPENDFNAIQCVRLEYKAGKYYAIASNRKIGVIWYLGETKQPDACAHVTNDAALIKQCETEKPFNSTLSIVSIPELQMTSIKTLLGYNYPGNAGIYPPQTPLADWGKWVPRSGVAASVGAMYWFAEDMLTLNAASPSGGVVFPEFIDAGQPVIVRDFNDPNWIGCFMANMLDRQSGRVSTASPAVKPEWWPK